MEFAVGRAEHEHTELSEAWKLLDTKSQATTAIAGIFIAAAFVFVRNTQLNLTYFEKTLLALVIFTLVLSILFAIRAMRVRDVSMPFTGLEALTLANSIISDHEQCSPFASPESSYNNLLSDHIKKLDIVNNGLRRDIVSKSNSLKCSHYSLLAASIVISVLTYAALFCPS
jgi:hypothetical protein